MRKSLLFTCFFIAGSLSVTAQQTVRLEIRAIPSYHPSGADLYAAGSFNGWKPADSTYRFSKSETGGYFLDLKLAPGSYEYKVTRGSWGKTECRKGGKGKENRVLNVLDIPANTTMLIDIEDWADHFAQEPPKSTASKQVHILDTAFGLPQLHRARKIWIYLPRDYEANPKQRYPVLYMHDGQNLFDDITSYAGEWGVDEFLDSTKLGYCIVIGIDNGGNKRTNEYNPYDNERFGKGEGDQYVDFIVKTLKPFIDKQYRTLKDRPHTMIAGSSMGGLISMYAVMKYPKVFGAAGIFSPSFWIAKPRIFEEMAHKARQVKAKIYFYAGGQEGESMVQDTQEAYGILQNGSSSKVHIVIKEDGKHNEERWRQEFPMFYEWVTSN